ncbi:cytochrome C oxidase, cbb3-type, subunit III [Aureococcus anophagefferens]|nr:cytochrome C oxidase, cbb3-type, subunit III [Aureococcus anophagefferens]
MKLFAALFVTGAAAFQAPSQSARSPIALEATRSEGDVESGATIFAGNCAACHAGGNNVIAAEKTLRKEALDSYLAGGRKESSVVTQVTNGKNAMPAFGGRLSDEEIGDVAAYVIDQANGDKWDE